ncbi:hypothetical protein [Streptomyces mirabilis]|uniref:hypothetical protein n=1 Tax=Streptomyces mirabilis TaxID=68239 RepID=UPI003677C215
MTSSVFPAPPDRIQRQDITVMQQATVDELTHIQRLWPSFEQLVGLRGRKMYAQIDERQNTYTVCTPVKEHDSPDRLGLQLGTLAGGWYLHGRLVGDPPQIYGRIADGVAELQATLPADDTRPLIEFYRRHDQIELWLPIRS